MSESVGRLANPLGPGMTPGGAPLPGAPRVPIGPGPVNSLSGGGPGQPPATMPAAAMVPRGGNGIAATPPPSPLAGARTALQAHHGENVAAYKQSSQALAKLDHIRKALDRLADKGDMVTTEDVIDEAGKLVGHGLEPLALAGILADMPQEGGGEALGGWIQAHAITAAQGEQQLMVQRDMLRHQMGVSGMHLLLNHTLQGHYDNGGPRPPTPPQPMDGGNALAMGGGQDGGNGAPSLAMGTPS